MVDRIVTPGAIDLHVHLREPSDNTSETIASGTRAAMLGGFVLVADMPNNPGMPVWTGDRILTKQAKAVTDAYIPTLFYAGAQPESDNIGELAKMAPHAVGLKLYGDPTTGNNNSYEAEDFKEIVDEWHRVAPDKPIMFHPGEENLETMADQVAGDYDHHLHICHVNDPEQVKVATEAKDRDLSVTCGVCPHHLLKTSHDVTTQGVFAEMKPPLAHQTDAEQLMSLLADGSIDVVETDFAPHSLEAKYQAEHSGGHCYGVPGIEHVMPLLFYQASKEKVSMERLIDATFTKPAEILGVEFVSRTEATWSTEGGAYRIGENDVEAGCGWSPYLGMLALGRLDSLVISGRRILSSAIKPFPIRDTRGIVRLRESSNGF